MDWYPWGEEALARVSEELERMKGRQKFLSDQVAFSTLRVTVNSRPTVTELSCWVFSAR